MELKRTIHLAEKERKENMTLENENDSEVRPTALHMLTYKLLCKRVR